MKRSTARLVFLALLSVSTTQAFADLRIDCYAIGGGGVSTGGGFAVAGSIGQHDAGSSAGGVYSVDGGYWTCAAGVACPGSRGDANCDGIVDFFDIDPFLTALFAPSDYVDLHCNGLFCSVDTDCNGAVDFFDIDAFLSCLFGGCAPCP